MTANTRLRYADHKKSFCNICPKGCGIIIHIEDGKPVNIEGDPEGGGKICIKGLNALDYVFHPERLTHPLIRSGKRGKGKWDQISWDKALDRVTEALNKIKEEEGAPSVAFIRGASKSYIDTFMARLANLFGSPNQLTMGQCCHLPRMMASNITCGYYAVPDIDYPPSCIIVWGYNPEETFIHEYEAILRAVEKGSKLIVIDPRKTTLAEKADLWIKVRPGTDLALALGMIHITINEKLYDKKFIEKWTTGFQQLATHIQGYTPEKVEEITWVPRQILKEATRIYAESRPACISLGNAIEQNLNSFQTARAIMILKAISGNMGIPGGEITWTPLPILDRVDPKATLSNTVPEDIARQKVSADCKILPMFKPVMPDNVIRAILEEKPYPIRAAFIQACNPILTFPNTQNVYKALNKLDFFVTIDMFMTPTAALADIVLPASSFLEYDSIFVPPQNIPMVLALPKVTQVGECWSDYKIVIELAKKLGLGDEFVWDNEEQALDAFIKPSGLTFEEFKRIGKISGSKVYRQYESKGFNTPTGKIEIYSARLEDWGYDPLPVYYEPPETPYSERGSSDKFPFILTSFKPESYRHSWGHQIDSLRENNPEPIVLISRETAQKMGIHDGDRVFIETKRGRIEQKAKLSSGIDPRVIIAEHGWWTPEKGINDPEQWAKSNINILTDDNTPFNRAMGAANEMGTPTLKGIFCNVYK